MYCLCKCETESNCNVATERLVRLAVVCGTSLYPIIPFQSACPKWLQRCNCIGLLGWLSCHSVAQCGHTYTPHTCDPARTLPPCHPLKYNRGPSRGGKKLYFFQIGHCSMKGKNYTFFQIATLQSSLTKRLSPAILQPALDALLEPRATTIRT